MTSPTPLQYDTYYHIYNRGVNRGDIFFEERNYKYSLKLYEKHIAPLVDTFAYCLLKNHFHWVIRVKSEEEISQTQPQTLRVSAPSASLRGCSAKTLRVSRKFSDFFNAYAKAINKAYNRTGSLFQHPFRRVVITTDRQFWNVIAYVHQNPQKHGFVDDFREWQYSSYSEILSDEPSFLQRDLVLDWFGGKEEYLKLHTEWVTEAKSKWFAGDDD